MQMLKLAGDSVFLGEEKKELKKNASLNGRIITQKL